MSGASNNFRAQRGYVTAEGVFLDCANCTAVELIDELIRKLPRWDKYEAHYLGTLLPNIVRGDIPPGSVVTDIAHELRKRLAADELRRLRQMVAERRAGASLEIESDTEFIERRQERKRFRKCEEERLDRERKEAAERQRQDNELQKRKQAFIDRAHAAFQADFLSADKRLQQDADRELLSNEEYLGLKVRFVQEWAHRELKQQLDAEQATAVASAGGDIQVVARAGAGKTRTLVTRALFLQKHCRISPRDLLLLAFNNAAAVEMRERLDRALDGNVPHVMTFHALAYALVHPEEALLKDEPSTGNLGLSREIQLVIDKHLQSEQHRPLIRDLMLMHFREDWEQIVEGGFHLPIDELLKYRGSLPRETLRGEYVKSFGERLIANTLFAHDIEYKYERNYRWSDINYKPDFTVLLPDHRGVVIEYFGLTGDPDYDQMSQQKRQFWAQRKEWTFLEFSPTDIASIGVERFVTRLLERLEQAGVTRNRLSDEEIWERIHRRAIDRFTAAMTSFVSRCRKRNLSSDDLRRIVSPHQHTPITEAEKLFLNVGVSVHSDYLRRLEANNQEDFDGLVWRAVALLKSGQSRFARDKGKERGDLRNVRFVLIDEFQDFSEMFYALAQGIRSLSPRAEFFCVGDDWQAINGFAGSDLRFFESFKTYFCHTTTLNVRTNYRSPAQIVKLGNALMAGRGTPAVAHQSDAGWVRSVCLSSFTPTAPERERYNNDEATPALLRLVKKLLDSGLDVVMLSRRNGVPWYVSYAPELPGQLEGLQRFAEHVRSFLPEDDRKRVSASTAHKYKGLEKGAVIVLDADEGSYPLIHPNWVFLRVFGDSIERIEAEERRLFYVALTRSKHSLVVLSDDSQHESPYIVDIRKQMMLDSISWSELPPVPSLDGARLDVRVFNAYEVRDQLNALGYHWNAQETCWHRSLMAQDFDFDALCGQPWARPHVRIEVYSEEGILLKRR